MRPHARGFWCLLVVAAGPLGGCATKGPASFDVSAEAYPAVFQAAKEELRRAGFTLDRVDARAGVITTRAKPSSGVFTPWIGDESTFGQEVETTLNHQRRIARVVFEPAPGAPADAGEDGAGADAPAPMTPMTLRVEVDIQRVDRPGVRPSSTSIRLSSETLIGAPGGGWEEPLQSHIIGRDPYLEHRLASAIRRAATGSSGG
jgi:hypothetical protein